MEQFWFPLRDNNNCIYVLVEHIVYLKADGNYTQVNYLDPDQKLQTCLQSGNLGKYDHILKHGFIRLRRDVIVNRSKVIRHGKGRTVTVSTGQTFNIPKKKWANVKELLGRQLVIPFGKKSDSFNKKDDSSIQ